jgi:hypothetical protein
MSVTTTIFDALDGDSLLVGLAEGGIHTTWAIDGTLPRIILGFSYNQAGSIMRGGSLEVDIFYPENDVGAGEAVRDRVIELLDGAGFDSDESGPTLRTFLLSDQILRDDPGHWSMTFNVRFYRKQVLEVQP